MLHFIALSFYSGIAVKTFVVQSQMQNQMNTTYTDEQALRKLHNDVVTAINTLNLEKLLSIHTDDIILMEPNMPAINGKEEVRKMFHKFQQENIKFQLAFNVYEIEIFGKRAFV